MTSKNFIWIRHAEKKFSNGWGTNTDHQHDPGIVEDVAPINNLVDSLVDRYGMPDKIVCSPFLRTRQTSVAIRNRLAQRYNKQVRMIINNDVKEYLGFCKTNSYADLDPETEGYLGGKVRTRESLESLQDRVNAHLHRIMNYETNVWVITHGIVISHIYKALYEEVPERPKPLNYVVFKNNQILKNF